MPPLFRGRKILWLLPKALPHHLTREGVWWGEGTAASSIHLYGPAVTQAVVCCWCFNKLPRPGAHGLVWAGRGLPRFIQPSPTVVSREYSLSVRGTERPARGWGTPLLLASGMRRSQLEKCTAGCSALRNSSQERPWLTLLLVVGWGGEAGHAGALPSIACSPAWLGTGRFFPLSLNVSRRQKSEGDELTHEWPYKRREPPFPVGSLNSQSPCCVLPSPQASTPRTGGAAARESHSSGFSTPALSVRSSKVKSAFLPSAALWPLVKEGDGNIRQFTGSTGSTRKTGNRNKRDWARRGCQLRSVHGAQDTQSTLACGGAGSARSQGPR